MEDKHDFTLRNEARRKIMLIQTIPGAWEAYISNGELINVLRDLLYGHTEVLTSPLEIHNASDRWGLWWDSSTGEWRDSHDCDD